MAAVVLSEDASANPGAIQRIVANGPNTHGLLPVISADGRFVAFQSPASNLVPGDTNNQLDVFVHDRQRDFTERVSVSNAGDESDGESERPAISADGRFVAFNSSATNLAPGVGGRHVFVRDRLSGLTELASVDSAGNPGNRQSSFPAISADGRFVAFQSSASNLTPVDTHTSGNAYDIFVRDRFTGTTELVSVDTAGSQGKNDSELPSISADGRFVAFQSAAPLVPGITNGGHWDIFVRDRQASITEIVSVDNAGNQAPSGSSFSPAITPDGRYVTFPSGGALVTDDTNISQDVFVHDRLLNTTTRASVDNAGGEANDHSGIHRHGISDDGRFVVFDSRATDLVGDDTNGVEDVFVRDLWADTTVRVSVDALGIGGNGDSVHADISADGLLVAFASDASNLVVGDGNDQRDVFVHELEPIATVGGIVELRTSPNAQSDQPASNSSLPLPASVAIGLLLLGAGGLYVVRMRRG